MIDDGDSPQISVVLCTYSMEMYSHFMEAARSILNQTYEPIELVVIVDGREDVYGRVKSDLGSRTDVQIHLNEINEGLLESRNTGVELASGEIVAFIDDDAVADRRWIEELVETYIEHNALAVGGRMAPTWMTDEPSFLPEEFYFLVGVTHKGFADGPGEVRNTFGSNLSFRRDVFLHLDGFDSTIGGRKGDRNLQGGETELCARLRAEFNEGVRYNPDAIVDHKVFDYRTDLWWLINRAFWQGYSKQVMRDLIPNPGREENEFLSKLIFQFFPQRLTGLVRNPSMNAITQITMLVILTGVTGLGYVYGVLS